MEKYVTIALEQKIQQRFKDGFDLIQVVLGPRQVGKTTTILQIIKTNKNPALYFTADQQIGLGPEWIDQVWQEALAKNEKCLLVIDEIQKIKGWSERIKYLWDSQKQKKSKIKVILLGSSSWQILEGLSESLTGRFELIRAHHWSLKESSQISKMNLEKYLKFGGYPGSYKYIKKPQRFTSYIEDSIVSTVIDKDVLNQTHIKNPALFKQTFKLLQTLPAVEISYTKLLGQLQDKGNTDLIKNYLELYEGAFLFTQIFKYSKKEFKTRLSTPKIISMCPALLSLRDKSSPEFLGRCFESLVGSDLVKTGLKVYYWRDGDYEVDFVIEDGTKIYAVEVKSQKRKSSKSLSEFRKQYPNAKTVYINFDNYERFAKDPEEFILDMSS